MQTVSQSEIKANQEMDRIISSLGELPSSPAVINTVLGMTSDFNTDTKGLSKALAADQTLTAKILKLSNSSFYGRAQGVATLEEAVIILGFFTLRSLVIATATHGLYSSDKPGSSEHMLWEHSLATAMASRILVQRTNGTNIEEAFIAGLMHDIGKLIFLQKMPEVYYEIIEKVENGAGTFVEHEKETFGFSHASLGAVLMIKWSFPQELIDAVADHHEPEKFIATEIGFPEPCSTLAPITNLANAMAKSIGVDFGEGAPTNLADLESAKLLGLDKSEIDSILKHLSVSFEQEKGLFSN